jgi:hypothetical protein
MIRLLHNCLETPNWLEGPNMLKNGYGISSSHPTLTALHSYPLAREGFHS